MSAMVDFLGWLIAPLCILSAVWGGLTFAVRNDDPMPWSASAALISSITCYIAVYAFLT